MAFRNDGEANGCTFIWKIENISQCWWMKLDESILSPPFIADVLQDTKWTLDFYPMGTANEHEVGLYLNREDCNGPNAIEIKYQLAFLDKDGLLVEETTQSQSFEKDDCWGFSNFAERERIFSTEKESLLSEDILTVQCTIWSGAEKPIEPKHLYAKTVFKTNRKSLVWSIDNFSSSKFPLRNKYKDGLIDIDLILNGRPGFDKEILIIMNSCEENSNFFSFKTFIVDSKGKKEICGNKEYFARDLEKGVLTFMLDLTKMLTEHNSLYLPNDILCLDCEIAFFTKTNVCELFGSGITSTELKNGEHNVGTDKFENATELVKDLKLLYNDGIFSDMELRTSTKTFFVHKTILSARSPVFMIMFNTDMEDNSKHVDIADMEDDTLHRMLLYIYTDSLEDLQYESAYKLYMAAYRYAIFSLLSKCSSFLKENLSPTNACDVLILVDQYKDDDMKIAVQDYILNHDEVFSSQEWMQFMNSNIKLAANVMYRKINLGKIA